MLSTERYTGEMKVMWDKKQAKRRQRRMESRKKAAAAAAARGERPPTPPGEKRPDSADASTYVLTPLRHNTCVSSDAHAAQAIVWLSTDSRLLRRYGLRVRVPEATGIPDMSQGFAFELRMTDVSAEGRPSHTWPLLTMGEERFLQFPEPLGTDRRVVSPAAALPWVQVRAQAGC